jgi:predicted RND superfamily exporter protein
MELLGKYGKAISKAPWAFITGIVVITLIMGYFSQNFESGTEEDAFTPDDEVSQANRKVREEFGTNRGQLTVVLEAEDNILSRDSLLAQLDLEERALDSKAADLILPSPEDPDGISSPAEIIIQSIFYTASFETSTMYLEGPPSNFSSCFDREKFINAFISKGFSLTIDEKREILIGGNITFEVDCLVDPVVIDFDEYKPSDLPMYTSQAPMAIALEFLLSEDYSTGSTSARKGLFVISTETELDPVIALEAEKDLDSISDDIEEEYEGLNFITIGDEIVSEKINEASGQSMGSLFLIALVMVVAVLIFVFKDWFEILINVIALFMAVIWVFGVGGMLGFSNNPSLTTVPVLVIGLGIDYGIHLTLRYREELRKGRSVVESIRASEASVGFAILLATITTLVGFLSNLTASSPGIRVFGILNATGILAAFIIMMSFVPAARTLRDRRRERKGKKLIRDQKKGLIWGFAAKRASSLGLKSDGMVRSEGNPVLNKVLSSGSSLALHPKIVIPVVVLLTVGGLYGGLQLEATFDFRDFLPDGLEVTDAAKSVVDDFDFSSEEGYVLAEGDVTQPEVFFKIDEVKTNALEGDDVVSSEPFGSPLELGRILTDPALPTYDENFSLIWHQNIDHDFDGDIDENISRDNVTAVYDAMFDLHPDQASRVLRRDGDDYTGLVVRIPVNSRGGSRAEEVRDQVRYAAEPLEELEGEELNKVTATGGPLVQQGVLEAIAGGQTRSIAVTFFVSLGILTLIFLLTKRSLFLGLVTILPLVLVLAWTTGGMYYFGIPLNVVTVTISAITIGLGIDYGVHISQRFLEDLDRIGDGICALSVSVSHTGTALFGSMMTTVIGFAILSLAIIPPLAQFGQVTALSVLTAFLASVFVLPTLLLLWLRGNRWYRRKVKGEDLPEVGKECTMPEYK